MSFCSRGPGLAARRRLAGQIVRSSVVMATVVSAARGAGTTEATPPALDWRAPAECPGRERVLEQLSEVLGQESPAQEAELGGLRIVGDVERVGARWVLTLRVDDGARHNERRLESERCEELGHAAALALALLLEERVAREQALAEAGSEGANEAPPTAAGAPRPEGGADAAAVNVAGADDDADGVTEDEPPSPDNAPSPPLFGVSAGARALLDSSTLPRPAWGLGASLSGRIDAWSAAVYAGWLPAQRQAARAGAQDVEFEAWAIGARGCRAVVGTRWVLDVCAGAEAGQLLASGLTLDRARDVRNPWVSAGPGVGLRWNRGGGAVQALAELMVPFARERYVVNEADLVHEAPAVTARLGLGFDLNL